jgi:hypothetical protein
MFVVAAAAAAADVIIMFAEDGWSVGEFGGVVWSEEFSLQKERLCVCVLVLVSSH